MARLQLNSDAASIYTHRQTKIPDRMCWQLSEMQWTQHCCLNAGKWALPSAHLQIGLWEMDFGESCGNFSGFCAAAVSSPSLTASPHTLLLLEVLPLWQTTNELQKWDTKRGWAETVGCSLEHRRWAPLLFPPAIMEEAISCRQLGWGHQQKPSWKCLLELIRAHRVSNFQPLSHLFT